MRTPFPVPDRRPPAPFDPVDATRLALRLAALASALDDLPRQARRFARWRVSRDAAGAQDRNYDAEGARKENRDAAARNKERHTAGARKRNRQAGRVRRVWPLRPGRPPGMPRRPAHEVHDILDVAHGLAIWAMEPRDTS